MSLSELMRGFKLALASIFAFLTTSLLLSCGAKIEQVVKIDELKKRVQRFDLLVIGDGSLAGFDINTLSISRGRFDRQKKQVFGDSLPAYLARYINQITSDRLTGFTNLSLVGSSLLD